MGKHEHEFEPGDRVEYTGTLSKEFVGKLGAVVAARTHSADVRVMFAGHKHSEPCNPKNLTLLSPAPGVGWFEKYRDLQSEARDKIEKAEAELKDARITADVRRKVNCILVLKAERDDLKRELAEAKTETDRIGDDKKRIAQDRDEWRKKYETLRAATEDEPEPYKFKQGDRFEYAGEFPRGWAGAIGAATEDQRHGRVGVSFRGGLGRQYNLAVHNLRLLPAEPPEPKLESAILALSAEVIGLSEQIYAHRVRLG